LSALGCCRRTGKLVELNPAHVTTQRHARGRRGVKTDPTDLVAISDLLLAGHGVERGHAEVDQAMLELTALVAHRARRVEVRTATKNQLLGQVDRAFPGLAGCLSSLLDTRVGRLVVGEFADPARLARLGPRRFRAFAARRGVIVQAKVADRLVTAARDVAPTDQAVVARRVLIDDLALLAGLDSQIGVVEQRLTGLLPQTPFQILATVPGSCTGRPGSPQRPMSRLAAATTAGSPGRARRHYAGRCLSTAGSR
jgi:transposase